MSFPFKDHFSAQAAKYAKFRPGYPDALFRYLAGLSPKRNTAWDCATGSGQSALALTKYFDRVIATDASEQQIQHAVHHGKIQYDVCPAEQTTIPEKSVDLVTVAQALHWFDFEAFYKEVKRVMKPDGIFAAWCYNLLTVSNEIDALLFKFYDKIVGPFWPPERKWIERNYQTIPFPFREIKPPEFFMEINWSLTELTGYLVTWSAVSQYKQALGKNPIDLMKSDLSSLWGDAEKIRPVRWPIYMRVGKV